MIFRRRSEADASLLTYRSILVPVSGAVADEDALRLAVLLLDDRGGSAICLNIIEVPFGRALDQTDPRAVAYSHEVVGKAEEFLQARGVAVRTGVVQARAAGPAIVDEAVESHVDLIIMGLPYKKRFGGAWDAGRTVPYVMRNSRAPVWCLRSATEDLAHSP
jgi:nucleotide-binding universal stress UspA family protein